MSEPEPPTDMRGASTDYVQSLGRGLSVIRAFDAEHPRRTLSDVARATDLTRATARRFLLTLVDLGYVRTDGSTFALTPRVLELGYSYLSSLSLPEIAGPHLEALTETVHESSSVSILDGDDVVYVARVPVSRIMTVSITIGTRFPAYATSMGRVLLAGADEAYLDAYFDRADLVDLTGRTATTESSLRAELDRVRDQGFCIVDQELEVGLRSLAAPLHGPDGSVDAAVNISTPAARYSLDDLTSTLLPALLRAAAAIDTDVSRVGSTTPDRGNHHA
ncbi:IclR family transcriptional regulator [Rhodococcus sp. Leaf7]|uniref:IclR family transcriptional regulator domain-containing protein n=1 Tax=unclassified Rhodococcus (in: high G+C Gram-positive bacteria) TaxID=192944 RepID=UPI0006F3BC53|nr:MULTISPECIES: IclR family transcriptional regulator C-terminal domain-containing protein [unclassified Rhodococcus (in: high G+C Gram-positive bacteria)]KQU03192.1 IclR family transcriptional regulator [Rhodococcus sp. Leaf7]KQU38292.1 IclR family transcriptional regulator [Rhodococcus sp. Leaf247]